MICKCLFVFVFLLISEWRVYARWWGQTNHNNIYKLAAQNYLALLLRFSSVITINKFINSSNGKISLVEQSELHSRSIESIDFAVILIRFYRQLYSKISVDLMHLESIGTLLRVKKIQWLRFKSLNHWLKWNYTDTKDDFKIAIVILVALPIKLLLIRKRHNASYYFVTQFQRRKIFDVLHNQKEQTFT